MTSIHGKDVTPQLILITFTNWQSHQPTRRDLESFTLVEPLNGAGLWLRLGLELEFLNQHSRGHICTTTTIRNKRPYSAIDGTSSVEYVLTLLLTVWDFTTIKDLLSTRNSPLSTSSMHSSSNSIRWISLSLPSSLNLASLSALYSTKVRTF